MQQQFEYIKQQLHTAIKGIKGIFKTQINMEWQQWSNFMM